MYLVSLCIKEILNKEKEMDMELLKYLIRILKEISIQCTREIG
jgi:hypothetical protein